MVHIESREACRRTKVHAKKKKTKTNHTDRMEEERASPYACPLPYPSNSPMIMTLATDVTLSNGNIRPQQAGQLQGQTAQNPIMPANSHISGGEKNDISTRHGPHQATKTGNPGLSTTVKDMHSLLGLQTMH